jgi:hypothetical protein
MEEEYLNHVGYALSKGIIRINVPNSLRMVDGSLPTQLEDIKEVKEDTKEVKEVLNVQGMILTRTPTTPDGGTIQISSGPTMIKPNNLLAMLRVHRVSFRGPRFLKTFLLLQTLVLMLIMIKCLKL